MNYRFRILLGFVISLFIIGSGLSAVTAQDAMVTSYNLGETIIIQDQFAADSRFYNMPVIMQGVLAVPEGEGPFPVALILHGAYTFCTAEGKFDSDAYPCPPESDLRQYEGFTYLAEALADNGYIAVVPDLSAEFNNGFAEPIFGNRAMQIIQAHLTALIDGADFGIDMTNKVDATQLVVVGHSRGGSLAVRYITEALDSDYPVSALALLTPAFFGLETTIPETLPTALVISECDGDVGTEQPLMYLDEQLPVLRPALTTIYTIAAGTHNAFSTKLEADPANPCNSEVLEPELQQAFAARFVSDFFNMVSDLTTRTSEG